MSKNFKENSQKNKKKQLLSKPSFQEPPTSQRQNSLNSKESVSSSKNPNLEPQTLLK
jgi:hypothetical protein